MASKIFRDPFAGHKPLKPAVKLEKGTALPAQKSQPATTKKKQSYLSEYERESLKVFTFNIDNIYNVNIIPRIVLKDLIVQTINELISRGNKTPFLLFPFQPFNGDIKAQESNGQALEGKDVQDIISRVFPRGQAPLGPQAILREIRNEDIYTLSGVLKWCWSRLPGGIITWKFYREYKEQEISLIQQKSVYPYDAFKSLMPRLVESPAHREIIQSFFSLLVNFCTMTNYNHMDPKKIIRLSGLWAFDLNKPEKDNSDFAEGIACWSVAAEACYHLFLAHLRTFYPDPRTKGSTYIDSSLEKILQSETTYPPPSTIYMKKAVTVPKVTLTVGRLSSSPFVLLQRISKIIQFEDSSKFSSDDDYNSLYFLFHDINKIEDHITEESRRVLNIVSKENTIFGDHPLKIKDTVNLPYDLRCRTWSKSYNHALIDPITGEPHRPLTNYVYEKHQRDLIKNANFPSGEKPKVPYPEDDTLPSIGNYRTVSTGPWKEVISTWQKVNATNIDIDKWNKDRRITAENLASCVVSNVAIDDYFIWLWMCSLSSEEDERRKALFGRSIVVEINLDNTPSGRRWIIVEEILNPRPPPMKQQPPPADFPLKTPQPDPPKKTRAVKEKKPVRIAVPTPKPVLTKNLSVPKKHIKMPTPILKSAIPAPAPPPVLAPAPEPARVSVPAQTQTIHISYDNIDPLVAAVSARLKQQLIDSTTQTDASRQPTPVLPISADDANNKGVQTYNTESIGVGTDLTPVVSRAEVYNPTLQPRNHVDFPNIEISPTKQAPASAPRDLRRGSSYEDVKNSIPYIRAEDSDDFEYAITPIFDPSVAPIDAVVIPKLRVAALAQAAEAERHMQERKILPQLDAEVFVSPIIDGQPQRRVFSSPSRPHLQQRAGRAYNEYEDIDYNNDHLQRHLPNPPHSGRYNHQNPNLNKVPLYPAVKAHGPLPPPLFPISANARETTRGLPAPPAGNQPQDEVIFDRSNNKEPVGFQNRIQNPMFRPSPHSSGNTSRSSPRSSQSPPKNISNIPRDFQNNELNPQSMMHHRNIKHPSKLRDDMDLELPRRPGHSRQRARSTANIPSVDDFMFDSGPMRGGAGIAKIPARNNHNVVPTSYPNRSNDSVKDVTYGSDTSYRYDLHEKAKASPDPPGIMKNRGPFHSKNKSLDSDSMMDYESEISAESLTVPPNRQIVSKEPSAPQLFNNTIPRKPVQNSAAYLGNRKENLTGNSTVMSSTVGESMVTAPTHAASITASMHSKSTSSFVSDEMNQHSPFSHEFVNAPPSQQQQQQQQQQLLQPLTHHSVHENSPSMIQQSTPEAINLSEFSATPTIPQGHDNSYSGTSTEQNRNSTSTASPHSASSTEQNRSESNSAPGSDQSHGLILDGDIGSEERPDTGISHSSWQEVKENLNEMKRRSQNMNNLDSLPPIVETKTSNTLGSISPEEYVNEAQDALRHPSIITGDHVKTIVVRNTPGPQNATLISSSLSNNGKGSGGSGKSDERPESGPIDSSATSSFVAQVVRVPPHSSLESSAARPPIVVVKASGESSSSSGEENARNAAPGAVPISQLISQQMLPPTESLLSNEEPSTSSEAGPASQKIPLLRTRRERYSTGSPLSLSIIANKTKFKDRARRILSTGSHPNTRRHSTVEISAPTPANVNIPMASTDPFAHFDFTNEENVARQLGYITPSEREEAELRRALSKESDDGGIESANGTPAIVNAMRSVAAAESDNTLGYNPPSAGGFPDARQHQKHELQGSSVHNDYERKKLEAHHRTEAQHKLEASHIAIPRNHYDQPPLLQPLGLEHPEHYAPNYTPASHDLRYVHSDVLDSEPGSVPKASRLSLQGIVKAVKKVGKK